MKISCIPVSYFEDIIKGKKTISEWAIEAKEIGYDYIDLSILFFKKSKKEYLLRLKEEIDKIGIGIAILNTYTDFTNPDEEKRKAEQARLKEYIKVAETLGAKYIRLTAGQAYPQTGAEDGITRVVEGLKAAVEAARGTPVGLLFENHAKPGIWEYTDFSFQVDVFLKIYQSVNGYPVKILFDTANPVASGADPLELLDKVKKDTVCIHVSDTEARGIFKPVLIGTGAVPFKEVFAILKEAGFKGIISVEEASFTGRSGIAAALKYIRDMWYK